VLEDYLRGIVLPEEAHEHAVEHGDWPTALLTARPSQRLDVLARAWRAGRISRDEMRRLWPAAWVIGKGRTGRKWLKLWRSIAKPLIEAGGTLPPDDPLTVYRVQSAGLPYGISWTTNPEVVDGMADSVHFQRPSEPIVFLTGRVTAAKVLAFIQLADQSEVIAPPDAIAILASQTVRPTAGHSWLEYMSWVRAWSRADQDDDYQEPDGSDLAENAALAALVAYIRGEDDLTVLATETVTMRGTEQW